MNTKYTYDAATDQTYKDSARTKLSDGKVVTVVATGTKPVVFGIESVPADSAVTVNYNLVVGAGVQMGNAINEAETWGPNTDGRMVAISNIAKAAVKSEEDALFDRNLIYGYV